MSDFDAIVVGAGPAGTSAAITMARGGLKVALLERGAYPGAKSLMGGVLYTDVLADLIPDFKAKGAPLERHVAEKRFSVLSTETATTMSFRSANWDQPPNNHSFSVLRAKFDKWYAEQAEAEGVELICGVTVDCAVKDEKGRVIGVRTRMPEGQGAEEGDLMAPVVISAEGANALLAEHEGMRAPLAAEDGALGVKEVLKLSEETIAERFALTGEQGVAWECIGAATGGLPGAGFVYTNRDTLSVGVVVYLSAMKERCLSPSDILDLFKAHPAVAPLIKGAEVLEYGAHQIPETGFDRMPALTKDGMMLVGDAAGLVSTSPRHEGSNYAMASGVMAGEAAIEAHKVGDFTIAGLAGYRRRLEESFVWKNIERYRDWPGFVDKNSHIFSQWPDALGAMQEAALAVDKKDAAELENELVGLFQRKVGLLPFAMTAFELRNALKLFGFGKTDKLVEYISRNW